MGKQNLGFTVLELLIVIAILLIGTSIALPSITKMGQRAGVKSDARDLKNVLFRARMEAVKLNKSVSVIFNHAGCDYMAFVDENDSCEYDGVDGEKIICQGNLSYAALDDNEGGGDGLTFVANDDGEPALRWDSKGLPYRNGAGFAAGTAYLYGGGAQYRVIMSKTGNVRISTY